MPVPVLALVLELLLAELLLPLVLELLAVVELVVAPGPWAALPPKPPSPSLLPSPSAALAHPCAALPIANATIIKPKPIVFTGASRAGLSLISEMIAIIHASCGEKLLEVRHPQDSTLGQAATPPAGSEPLPRYSAPPHEKEP
jgi:hypothetical protein